MLTTLATLSQRRRAYWARMMYFHLDLPQSDLNLEILYNPESGPESVYAWTMTSSLDSLLQVSLLVVPKNLAQAWE